MNVETIESASPSWTRSTLAHDQVIRWTKAKVRETQIPYYVGWRCGKVKWKSSKCPLLTKNYWVSMENQLNSSGIFSQDWRRWRFFRKSRMFCENGTLNLKNSQIGSSSCQCSAILIGQKKGNDGICISNSEKVKTYAKKFSQGHWTFLSPRAEKKWYGTLPETPEGKCDSTATQMVERFKDSGHPVFKSMSALSRGILKKNSDRDTIHFNGDASNTDLLFRIIHFVEQLSMYGAVSNWCEQVGLTEDEKGQEKPPGKKESVTKGVLTSVKSQEVNLLVSSRRLASGSSLRENIQDFESLSERIWFTRVCEDAIFVHRVSAGMSYKTRPDEYDGFGQLIPWCREYTLSRVNPRSSVFASIPGGTIIGPVIVVQTVKILDTNGLEIAFPSPNDSRQTSHVMISRGKSRFVDELLAWRYRRPALRKLVRPLILPPGNWIRTLSAFLPAWCTTQKEPFLRLKESGKSFLKVHRMEELCRQQSPKWFLDWCVITTRWKNIWRSDSLGQDKAGTVERVRRTGSTRFLRQRLASTYSSWKQ